MHDIKNKLKIISKTSYTKLYFLVKKQLSTRNYINKSINHKISYNSISNVIFILCVEEYVCDFQLGIL